ncbi:ribosomal biogenesis protein LAS1L [Tachyglossus aculeatus]|uniref:ribosomal biogenesis protein LAS1L n=1 Tax=Tachyglossus aculeatus TaxID=9261 RepID=UPI0018F32211|nr:ribosomal biogenesis protein LAS1L [Tachyglossus aculeatus]
MVRRSRREWPGGWGRALWERCSVVAWLSKAEWDQVMVYLFCPDCKLQQYALHRVSAWKSRSSNNLPLAVACTADLVLCTILDVTGDLGPDALLYLYGMALVRFINLITERRKALNPASLRELAFELNIPDWIVSLRHDLTHGKLPQLSTCRKGCKAALDWLRRTYWCRQLGNNLVESLDSELGEEAAAATAAGDDNGDKEEDDDNDEAEEEEEESGASLSTTNQQSLPSAKELRRKELYEKVRDVLVSYEEQLYRELEQNRKRFKDIRARYTLSEEVKWIVAQLKDMIQENRGVVLDALLDEGFLIPTEEQLAALRIPKKESADLDRLLLLPRPVSRFWQPLLSQLDSHSFMQALLERMLTTLPHCASGTSGLRHSYLLGWIAELLVAHTKCRRSTRHLTTAQWEVRKSWMMLGPIAPLQWPQLVQACLAAPCWASPHLLQLILKASEEPPPLSTQEKLLHLCTVYTQGGSSLPGSDSGPASPGQPVYTLESLRGQAWGQGPEGREPGEEDGDEDEEEAAVAEEKEEEEEEEMELEGAEREGEEDGGMERAAAPHLANVLPLTLPVPISPEALAEKQAVLQGSAWQLSADDVQWGLFPLGKLPGQTEDPGGLLLTSYTVLDQPAADGRPSPTPSEDCCLDLGDSGGEGLLWTPGEMHRLKAGLQLF